MRGWVMMGEPHTLELLRENDEVFRTPKNLKHKSNTKKQPEHLTIKMFRPFYKLSAELVSNYFFAFVASAFFTYTVS